MVRCLELASPSLKEERFALSLVTACATLVDHGKPEPETRRGRPVAAVLCRPSVPRLCKCLAAGPRQRGSTDTSVRRIHSGLFAAPGPDRHDPCPRAAPHVPPRAGRPWREKLRLKRRNRGSPAVTYQKSCIKKSQVGTWLFVHQCPKTRNLTSKGYIGRDERPELVSSCRDNPKAHRHATNAPHGGGHA
jgi:hypothetical protein